MRLSELLVEDDRLLLSTRSDQNPTEGSIVKSRLISAVVASVVLAGGVLLGGAVPANAVPGNCSGVISSGESPSYLASTCSNSVKIRWKCSSDAFGTLNSRSFNYPNPTYIRFLACNSGKATNQTWTNV